jgi:hypothetical protein
VNRSESTRGLDDGFLPVKVVLPMQAYKRLYAEASAAGITIGQLIARTVAVPPPVIRRPIGRPSGYTSEAGESITADRRYRVPWSAIAERLGVSEYTARAWKTKYENEVREQNLRDRAERKAP